MYSRLFSDFLYMYHIFSIKRWASKIWPTPLAFIRGTCTGWHLFEVQHLFETEVM